MLSLFYLPFKIYEMYETKEMRMKRYLSYLTINILSRNMCTHDQTFYVFYFFVFFAFICMWLHQAKCPRIRLQR